MSFLATFLRPSLAIFLGAGLLAGCSRTEPAPEPVRAVRTIAVSLGEAGGSHEYAAEIRARTESQLGFRVGGKLTERPAEVGQVVRAGQVLARLDPEDLRLNGDAARAALNAAQVNLDQAASDYKRYKELREQGFISDAELERRDNTLKAAQAQRVQAAAQASVQGNQAAYSALLAPAAGVVTAVEAEVGAVLGSGTPVLRLALDGPRDAVFSVPEDRVDALRGLLGRPGALKVRLWGATAQSPATVREVAAAADPATRTFLVRADLGRADVRLGQTAVVTIESPPQPGIVKLPLTAVTQVEGRSAVWLVDAASMTVKAQPISIGGADGNWVVVRGGLSAGQRVVTAGVHVLTPGQKVSLYVEPAAAAAPATQYASAPASASAPVPAASR